MDVRSPDSNFLAFSNPVDTVWLTALKNHQKIYLIGTGVTAKEYEYILVRNGISFKQIEPDIVIKNPDHMRDGFSIIACPRDRKKVVQALDGYGYQKNKQYAVYFQLLRNRAVIDFRNDIEVEEAKLNELIVHIQQFETVGGIDILINSTGLDESLKLVLSKLNRVFSDYHVKLSVEVVDQGDLSPLKTLNIDLVELLIRQNNQSYFDARSLEFICEQAKFKQAHVIYIDCDFITTSHFYSIEQQHHHPSYYDELLVAAETDTQRQPQEVEKGVCVSRRMFPVFDHKLNLKLCSLYDELAKTEFSCSTLLVNDYIQARNELCLRCEQAGLHRRL